MAGVFRTGVFFHPEFARRAWPVIGERFSGFPAAMGHALSLEGVRLIEPRPAPEELLLKVHTPPAASEFDAILLPVILL